VDWLFSSSSTVSLASPFLRSPEILREPRYDCVVCLLSQLAPVYAPNDVLSTPVPDLLPQTANFGLGEARLIDCLFTPYRW
jgi:hypothetical protein